MRLPHIRLEFPAASSEGNVPILGLIVSRAQRTTAIWIWSVILATSIARVTAEERFIPLTELGTAKYRGEVGGLYGNGQNEPPTELRQLASDWIGRIEPRDDAGKPSPDGKIVLMSIGMSNTLIEFTQFKRIANLDRRKRPELVLVNGARGSADAAAWAGSKRGNGPARPDPWVAADARLNEVGVTAAQVQVIWIKLTLAFPAQYGEFPGHVQALADALENIVRKAKERYPNLCVAFLSSRIYGGYATTQQSPEPHAYEDALAIRTVIARQKREQNEKSASADQGAERAPLLLWGPYLWADGQTPRKDNGLAWSRGDFMKDGTHPNLGGQLKVAELLLEFFTEDEFGKAVFLGR
jgi:hypothetical protein